MLRKVLFLCTGALSLAASSSQPVLCTEENQCSVGYYCEVTTHECRECFTCEYLNRQPPKTPTDCIRSIALCGDCFEGWKKDGLGDVNSACVRSDAGGTEHYVWWPWLLSVGILIFFALVVIIVVYVWKNPSLFENLKYRGNSHGGTVSTDIRTVGWATAPEAPPPYYIPNYDVPYSSVRGTESPCPPQHDAGDPGEMSCEEEGPFLKCKSQTRPNGVRESSANQAATVYNLPNYEQDLASSPEPPAVTEVTNNLPIYDEETVASLWTPNGPSHGDINANTSEESAAGAESGNLSVMLAAARDTTLVDHPEPKRMRLQPTSNRNRDSNSPDDSNQSSFSGGQNGQPLLQIVNLVQINRAG